jgi:hypothetical protein
MADDFLRGNEGEIKTVVKTSSTKGKCKSWRQELVLVRQGHLNFAIFRGKHAFYHST